MSAYKRKKRHMMVDTMPAVPLDEAEIFRWRDRLPPDDDEAAWAALAKLKKRDMNDIAAEGQAAFDDWWNDTSNMVRISLPRSEDPLQVSAEYQSPIINLLQLGHHYPTLKPPIIHGLIRQGETMNIVAPPKVGKSWLTGAIAINIVTGQPLFNEFKCEPGRVLIIDNELHCQTIWSRMKDLMPAMDQFIELAGKRIDYIPLRGELVDLISLESYLKPIFKGHYNAIILDAFYKFFPRDMRENDNAQITALYNQIDYYAEMLDTTFILVHHASKGNQSEKSVTDVGAGGGAQSRATDCHLVLREHEYDKVYRIDAAVRSWAPVKPFCARFNYPIWIKTNDDPEMLKGQKKAAGATRVWKTPDAPAGSQSAPTAPQNHDSLLISLITEPMTIEQLSAAGAQFDPNRYSVNNLRKILIPTWQKLKLIQGSGGGGRNPKLYTIYAPDEPIESLQDDENQVEESNDDSIQSNDY